MKILHTSDWHLGKLLDTKPRYGEHQHFIDELAEITERENIDAIILSGDIYDTSNPPAAAETMFFNSIVRLAKNGSRPVIVIAGNHDSPDRLMAAAEILRPYGVFVLGRPMDFVPDTKIGGWRVYSDEHGAVVLEGNDEKAVIAALPYVSDRRIGDIIGQAGADDEENAVSYSNKIKELFSKLSAGFCDDTINIAAAHLYTVGGTETGSERSIQLGGSLAVSADAFPNAQYIALGHLHRPQTVQGLDKRAFYSGSPLAFSKDEAIYSKAVNLVNVRPGEKAQVEKILLSCIKPIEIVKCGSFEEAFEKCRDMEGRECYVYLEIEADRPLSMEQIRQIKSLKTEVMDIRVALGERETAAIEERSELSLRDSFVDFYKKSRSAEPDNDIVELFMSIIGEEEQ